MEKRKEGIRVRETAYHAVLCTSVVRGDPLPPGSRQAVVCCDLYKTACEKQRASRQGSRPSPHVAHECRAHTALLTTPLPAAYDRHQQHRLALLKHSLHTERFRSWKRPCMTRANGTSKIPRRRVRDSRYACIQTRTIVI